MHNDIEPVRYHVQKAVAFTSVSDPVKLAERMIARSTAEERDAWLFEALPGLIANILRSGRNRAFNETPTPTSPPQGRSTPSRPTSGRRMPSRSAKVAGVRDWWAQFLASRISVEGTWKPVGELTADDLASVIAERENHAAATLAQASKYATLLELMTAHNVSTVADLPRDSIEGMAA